MSKFSSRASTLRGMRRLLALVPVVSALATPAVAEARLPVVEIEASRSIPDEPKAPATLRMPGFSGRIGIERRGQSSQRFFPMKSYSVELSRDAGLLGMPEDDDWVLYAPYNDKTLMRNVVAYRTAALFGRYAARTRFVRLRLNGRPHGIYVLMEKLELGKDRVQAEALYELTFPFQARSKKPSFRTPIRNRPIVWEDPERGDLSKRRAIALARTVRDAERALYGPGRWRQRIDAASAADFALLNELFKNEDAFHASTYMSLHADGRLRMGPVWDFDVSMGNSDYGPSSRLRGWMLSRRDWAERMYADRSFIRRMGARWRELRAAGLRGKVMRIISASHRALRGPARSHFRRWPVLGRRVWPNPAARGSYRAEVRFLRSWVSRRMSWLDRRFIPRTRPRRG
jgi:CotH kinase protein